MGEAEHTRVCSAYYESWVVGPWCLVLRCWVLWVMDARCLVLLDGRGLWDTNNIRRNERSLVFLRGAFLPSPMVSISETAAPIFSQKSRYLHTVYKDLTCIDYSCNEICWEANDPDYSQVVDVPPCGLFPAVGR